ncbi:MAG TPA: dihydroorotate dehydrogenase electron transfer subunit [Paludibacteraceae bacterium]|nr:dihydroorotate dehydrogenase electron transfer subunit [Paludibacteraceae bacterium]HQJ89462.1 dihydroorotate dehydrogenase electron transfer subunit [Paludibacteraceae bacterium]
MRKYLLDLTVSGNEKLSGNYILMKLTSEERLPDMLPGQFAEVRVDNSPSTFLRRPISIHFVDRDANELWFLIQLVGDGTRKLAELKKGDIVNVMVPLGNSFTMPSLEQQELLLVGGGVGIAPMLMLGAALHNLGYEPTFLIGARTKKDLLQLDAFENYGKVYMTTEDASCGEKGFVTNHSILSQKKFDKIYTCGPTPMMKAVAAYAAKNNIDCEVSLENKMACGVGACICCVTDTTEGHKCVCSDGPVFNIKDLKWQI